MEERGDHFECREQVNRGNKRRNFFLVLPPLLNLFVAWVALSSLPAPSPVLSGLGSGNGSDSNGREQNPCSGAVGGRLIHRLLSFTILKLCVCDVSIQSDHNFTDAFRLWRWEDSWDSKEIKPVNPKGNQSWIFIGRTDTEAPKLWPPVENSQLIRKKYWYWERLRAGGQGTNREWDGWMASPDSMHMSLNKLQKMVKDRETWRAAVHGITKSGTRLKWLNNNELTDLGNQSFTFSEWFNIKWSLGYCHHSSLAEYLTRG